MASFTDYAGKRTTDNDVQTYQFLAGFEGELEGRDLTWEAYLSHGSTDVSTLFGGVISIERYRYLVNLPNYGRNAFDQGNDFSAAHIAGGTLRCTTGLPIVQEFTPSEDCIEAIVADLQSTSEMDQTIAELNVQGKLVDMWAGEARFAAGVVAAREYVLLYSGRLGEPDVVLGRRGRHLPGRQLARRGVDVGDLRRVAVAVGVRVRRLRGVQPRARLPLLGQRPDRGRRNVQGDVRLARQRPLAVARRPQHREPRAEHRRAVRGEDADRRRGRQRVGRPLLRQQYHRRRLERESGVEPERGAGPRDVRGADGRHRHGSVLRSGKHSGRQHAGQPHRQRGACTRRTARR